MTPLRDLSYRLMAVATVSVFGIASALAQAGGSGDPAAPIDLLRTARTRAAASGLNAEGVAAGGNRIGIILTVLFAVVGIGLAGASGVSLYKASQDENSRQDTGRSVAGLVIGSLLTIIGIVVGVITSYASGS